MYGFLLVCILILLLVRWVVLSNRLNRMEERIQLLQNLLLSQTPRPAAEPETKPEPVRPPVIATEPRLSPMPAPPRRPAPAPAVEKMPETVAASEPFFAGAPRRDWEATLGGNLLNKAGVVLLVIGLALALAYSFAHIGPAGRVAISLAVSIAMLAAGVIFEPRERYQVFARGLLGGGWAGLYTTVYAMHAVKEALVIPDPFAGTLLLIAVAVGMIAHSLRYRSQTVTGLAYFIAFGTVSIAEVNILAIVALVPLAASLLYIAHRFDWVRMAMFGLVATYGVVVIRGDHGSPLWQAQLLFAIFWLVFEAFDILHPEAWLLPLNAVGFLGLSLLKWNHAAPHDVWMLLAGTAAAYLASAALRGRSGKWQAAATLAAGLGAAAIFGKLEHQWVASALLVEAELVYLAGVGLRKPYLRWLGTLLFGVEVGQLLLVDMVSLPTHTWTSIATVNALVFYANRFLVAADLLYGYAAAGLLALVIGYEAPARYRTLEWLGLAAGLFSFGWWRRLFDFRMQGYLMGILGLGVTAWEVETNQPPIWGALIVSYALTLCATLTMDGRFEAGEELVARFAGAIASSLAAVALVWRLVPAEYLGLVWMALALVLLEAGVRRLPTEFRVHSYVVAALGALRIWEFNSLQLHKSHAYIPAAAALLSYVLAGRAWSIRQRTVYAAALAGGTLFLMNALWIASPEWASAPLWALVALALTWGGLQWDQTAMPVYGYIVAVMAFARCWGIDFEMHLHAIPAASVTAACFFRAQLLAPRERFARIFYALLGTALITLLLFYEASGSLLTVSWGVEGVALLCAGFPLRDRVLRLSGLVLLMSCILKLFLWDLRHLETLPRIFSFIVLGLILVGVSWIYTRFREHVERYL
ncbi:MAG TPA: DUF2339 domain-containing protein [Candidatus Sulfopaludibacter sp.]|jgi:uncharacterized membrane protein|nr:DUF2339 domain-containing protein [Candidatus Sulfopaludibacter sp.]